MRVCFKDINGDIVVTKIQRMDLFDNHHLLLTIDGKHFREIECENNFDAHAAMTNLLTNGYVDLSAKRAKVRLSSSTR